MPESYTLTRYMKDYLIIVQFYEIPDVNVTQVVFYRDRFSQYIS